MFGKCRVSGADPQKENFEPLFFKEEEEEEDEGCVPGTAPVHMASSSQVLDLLSGKNYEPIPPQSAIVPPQGKPRPPISLLL